MCLCSEAWDKIKFILFLFFPMLLWLLEPPEDKLAYAQEAVSYSEKFEPPIANGFECLQEVRIIYQRNDNKLESTRNRAKDYLFFSGGLLTALITVLVYAATASSNNPILQNAFLSGWNIPKVALILALIYTFATMFFCTLAVSGRVERLEIGSKDIVTTKDNINLLIQKYLEMNHKNIYPINQRIDYLIAASHCLMNSFSTLIIGLLVFLVTCPKN